MKTIPMAIETIVPRMRYATALLIDMSIGPIFSSGPQVCELPLVRRVELGLFGVGLGLREREGRQGEREQRHDCECALHAFASPPK